MNKIFLLKYRLLISYILLSVIICMVFIAVFDFSEDFIEEKVIYPRLDFELTRYMNGGGDAAISASNGLAFYNEDSLPESLKHLKPHRSLQDVLLLGGNLSAVVGARNGKRFVVVDVDASFERIEETLFIIILLASFFSILVAWLFSQVATRSVVAPLSSLANKVNTDAGRLDLGIISDDEIGTLARH